MYTIYCNCTLLTNYAITLMFNHIFVIGRVNAHVKRLTRLPGKIMFTFLGLEFTISYHYPFILFPSFPLAYAMLYVLDYPFFLSHQWNSIRLIKISISARSRHLHEILLNNSHVCLIFDIVRGGIPNDLLCAREESCEGNVSSTFFDPDFPVLK